ncbi:MAG TPA: type I-MYXAN CRISPR-associated protein Cas6/Cmx6 [Candidatus Thioglobus sp.]|jgi:CRISPR-associated protein Cas6|nr:type I-MYXAN CRISPR-associated protein Cas6/Cmx6 [Candidatus Thioglobus sp.]HIL41840.1 type I-MYXAN CRISPR-associated protein Cas6/Cmx6 [Gammaproteobacteria bacterium]
MYWQEDIKEEHYTVPDDFQDAVFNIDCKILPIDHAYMLSQALIELFPWLKDVDAGIHDISVADGNGWKQDHESGFFYPSKRSKLSIRLPKSRLNDIQSLTNRTLDMGQYRVKIVKQLEPKLMSDMQVLFAKYVDCNEGLSEDEFLQKSYEQLKEIGVSANKMMAGLERKISTPNGFIHTKSLMIASLKKSESVALQELGIGNHRLLGCGLFVPQKDIESVSAV